MIGLEVDITKKLNNFTLNVKFNCGDEVLALLGASGCGKSMTLKCIAGIETPDNGKIVLNGKTLFDSSKGINLHPQKRKIGYLFQEYALFPNMTISQNIGIGIKNIKKSEKKAIVKEYIENMQLEGLENKYPREISGGQQQRVALARILASSPSVILLDEPFSSLDSYLKWQLEIQLSDILKDYRGIVIWVSHDRNEVYRNCKDVCIMSDGNTSKVRPIKELFNKPDTLEAARITGCKNFISFAPISNSRIFIPDWNIYLNTLEAPNPAQRFIGIRAHWIHAEPQEGDNPVTCSIERITEDTFSIILMLKPVEALPSAPLLRYEFEKSKTHSFSHKEKDTITIGIRPEDIMLLE